MTADEPGTGPAAAPAAGGRRRATPPAHSSHRSRGPRAGGPRRGGVTATGVLAVLVPLLTVAAFVLVRPGTAALDDVRPPSTSDLTRATLVCPAGTGQVEVGTAAGTRGTVSVRLGDAEREVAVRPGRLSAVESDDAEPAEVTGLDDLAPGLLAGRSPTDGATRAAECRAPRADQWFTGAGAAARHPSVLELVNPDGGPRRGRRRGATGDAVRSTRPRCGASRCPATAWSGWRSPRSCPGAATSRCT